MIAKALFRPMSLVAGLLAALVARKTFDRVWRVADHDDPPKASQRDASLGRMVAALALEGAIFKVAKGLADHGARRAFAGATGTWPGKGEEPPTGDSSG